MKEMLMNLDEFKMIGNNLAKHISDVILKQVIFEASGINDERKKTNALKGHYHFRVPKGENKKVPAWINWRKTQNISRLVIRGDLLPKSGLIVSSMIFKPNANYSSASVGGVGEWTISIDSLSNENYQIALNALIIACKSC